MEIYGEIGTQGCDNFKNHANGAFYTINTGTVDGSISASDVYLNKAGFKASRSWTGTTNTTGNHSHTVTVNNTGGSQAHNNLPPYRVVNIWRRTA